MNNFYIAFAVYLNLIFVAAKLWNQISWSWFWVMSPLIILTVIGVIVQAGQSAQKKHLKSNILNNLQNLRDLIESSKIGDKDKREKAKEKEKDAAHRIVN